MLSTLSRLRGDAGQNNYNENDIDLDLVQAKFQ